jgi:hypothetical protein
MATMTEKDLENGQVLAVKIVEMLGAVPLATAVVGVAMAMAAVSLLAECGPDAPVRLYRNFYQALEEKAARRQ